jgi:hypothetical protein
MSISISKTGKILSVIAIAAAFVLLTGAGAFARGHSGNNNVNGQETCPKTGNGWVKVDDLSGLTYTFTDIPYGYEVTDNCYKAGTSVVYGSGPTVTSTVWNKEGCTKVGRGCNYQELSHASFKLAKKDTPKGEYYFQFAKEWKGDKIDLTNVEVTFYIGEAAWQIGNPAVEVKPGTVLEPLSEKVTGLPANCSYKSDLPSSYTVFKDLVMDEAAARVAQEYEEEAEVMTDTLTATNTVTCTDGTVAGVSTTATPQVTATPVGAVDAGGAGSTALIGLVGSTVVVALGAAIRKFSL